MTSSMTIQNSDHIAAIEICESPNNNVTTYLQLCQDTIKAELAKAPEERNQDKLYEWIMRALQLLTNIGRRIDQEHVANMAIELQEEARKVQASYDSIANKVCTYLSVAISVVAAGAAFAPLTPMGTATAEAFSKSSQALSGLAQGATSVGGIFSTQKEADKQYRITQFDENKRRRDDTSGRKRTAQETANSTNGAIDDHFRNKRTARQEMLRVT